MHVYRRSYSRLLHARRLLAVSQSLAAVWGACQPRSVLFTVCTTYLGFVVVSVDSSLVWRMKSCFDLKEKSEEREGKNKQFDMEREILSEASSSPLPFIYHFLFLLIAHKRFIFDCMRYVTEISLRDFIVLFCSGECEKKKRKKMKTN